MMAKFFSPDVCHEDRERGDCNSMTGTDLEVQSTGCSFCIGAIVDKHSTVAVPPLLEASTCTRCNAERLLGVHVCLRSDIKYCFVAGQLHRFA